MTRVQAEILILVINTLFTGTVMFVAGTLKGVMNEMDLAAYKLFVASLQRHALRSPYVVLASSITFLLIIPYFIIYGFANGWFIAGMISCLMASISSKVLNVPIYRRIGELDVSDMVSLNMERRRMGNANAVRAAFYLASVFLVICGFFTK